MDIPTLLSSLAVAKDLGVALLNERDRQKAAAIQNDLTEKIVQAQVQFAEVFGAVVEKDGTIQALRERIRELEARENEKARYRLAKIGTVGQVFAYELRPAAELSERQDEPAHFLCQPCFDAGKKSVLRVLTNSAFCTVCSATFPIKAFERIAPHTGGLLG